MKIHRWTDIKDRTYPRTAEKREADRRWVEEQILAMNLSALRLRKGLTQEQLARRSWT